MRAPAVLTFVALVLSLTMSGCGTATSSSEDAAGPPSADPASGSTPDRSPESGAVDPQEDREAGQDPDAAVPAVYDFSSQTVDGAAFEGPALAGRPAVLWFWAPWCPTCRAQIDGVSAAAEQYADQVAFVGVGGLDDGEAIDEFAADVPAQEITQLTDPDGEVWRHFGITEQSTYVVLDAEGRTVASGYLDDAELLDVLGDLTG